MIIDDDYEGDYEGDDDGYEKDDSTEYMWDNSELPPPSPPPPPPPPLPIDNERNNDDNDGGNDEHEDVELSSLPDILQERKEEEEEMEVNTLIFLVTGDGADPYGTRSMLFWHYNNAPDYILSFIGWLNTPTGRVARDDGLIAIEASPIPGRIYVNGQLTGNDLTKFFLVITDSKKQSYHYCRSVAE